MHIAATNITAGIIGTNHSLLNCAPMKMPINTIKSGFITNIRIMLQKNAAFKASFGISEMPAIPNITTADKTVLMMIFFDTLTKISLFPFS